MDDPSAGHQREEQPGDIPAVDQDAEERRRLIEDLAFLVVRQHRCNLRRKTDSDRLSAADRRSAS
mgnify:CR=1 FL=1